MRKTNLAAVLCAAMLTGACNLDLQDPNLPTEDKIITTSEGIAQIAVGLQAEFSNEIVDPIYVNGLVSDALGAGANTFEGFQRIDRGDPPDNSTDPSAGPWSGMYDVVQIANVLIANAPNVGMGPGTTSGVMALAKLYKAMAFGNLVQIYQRIPLNPNPATPAAAFATREEALTAVLTLLNEARQQIATTPPSDEFNRNILAPGFDLANTIEAMLARYNLIAGNLAAAAAAAARVNPTVLSELRYSANDPNPLYVMWYSSGNAFQMRAEDAWRLAAQPGDQRVDYWVTPANIQGAVVPLDDVKRYRTREASIPVYLPDEMKLITAEVLARQNNLAGALAQLNAVRTQCSSALNEPVACLPALTASDVPTQGAMLTAIYRERRYELFLQALDWSDMRRFGLPVKYQFMVVPETECSRNPSTPQELCRT